MSQNSFL